MKMNEPPTPENAQINADLRLAALHIPNHRRRKDGSPTLRWTQFLARRESHFKMFPPRTDEQPLALRGEVPFISSGIGVCNVCGMATEPGQILLWVPHVVARHVCCTPTDAYLEQIRNEWQAARDRQAAYLPALNWEGR